MNTYSYHRRFKVENKKWSCPLFFKMQMFATEALIVDWKCIVCVLVTYQLLRMYIIVCYCVGFIEKVCDNLASVPLKLKV